MGSTEPPAEVTLARIIGFRLVTRDGDRLARFYAALGFAVNDEKPIEPAELAMLGIVGGGWRRRLQAGEMDVDLDRFERPGESYPTRTTAGSACFQHLALVTGDVTAAWRQAAAAGAVPISGGGPVTLPASGGGVTAIKFRDPEGHPLELIHFPGGAGKDWTGEGLLGVDHSALVATDLAASQAFYAGLGLCRGDATLNRGPTQAALDGLEGALVDVVPMLPAQPTPHVELLHYRSPAASPSRPWVPADVVATRIVWAGDAPALLRDPDGHLHQIEG